jgi:ATP-dependent protease ClpP protease subunit
MPPKMMKTARPIAQLRQGRTDWFRIENLAGGSTASIYVYDEIGYWGVTASDFVAELSELAGVTQIDLHVNSPGGDVFEGLAIMNCLRAHPANVTTYVDGIAASIASVIAMAGDQIVMGPHSQLMIHEGSALCIGNAADMRKTAELLDFQSDNIAGVYAARAGGTVEAWRALMVAETWYTAEEAVKAGLADEVAQRTNEPVPAGATARMDNSWDLSIYRYAGREHAPAPVARLANVARQFAQGDRVRVTGTPHEEGQSTGTVDEINGNAYGITFDGMEDMGVHRWYVDNELEVDTSEPANSATGGSVTGLAPAGEVAPVESLPPSALTTSIAAALGEDFVAALRASVQAEFAAPAEPVPAEPESVPAVEAEPVEPEQPSEPEPVAEPEDPAATVPEVEPEPVAPAEPAAPELVEPEPEPVVDSEPVPEPAPINAWAAAIAHLTTPAPDPWSAAFAHLIAPPSPSAATNALKEAS